MKKEFKVKGMTCHHCVKAVVMELDKLNINSHQVDIGEVIVDYDENELSEDTIKRAIEEAGYEVVN